MNSINNTLFTNSACKPILYHTENSDICIQQSTGRSHVYITWSCFIFIIIVIIIIVIIIIIIFASVVIIIIIIIITNYSKHHNLLMTDKNHIAIENISIATRITLHYIVKIFLICYAITK